MSDLSSNETLDPLDNITSNNAQVANTVDNVPEDWEDIIDFEMKNGKEDTTMESSQENDVSLANQLQAEEDALQKDESMVMETNKQTTPDANSTVAAHGESDNEMAIEETSTDKNEGANLPNGTVSVPQAPASAAVQHTNTDVHAPVTHQMFQRLLKKGVIANDQQLNKPRSMAESCRPLEEILINFAEEDKASIGFFNNLIYLPPYLLEKYLAPTAKAIKRVNDLANILFSESDATVIKALFAQAFLTSTNAQDAGSSDNPIDITEQPVKDTISATNDLKDIMKSKATALEKYVEQLRKAAELPDEQTILAMADEELLKRNQKLDRLFTSFEAQIKRDYLTFQKIRTENMLLASVNYSQLKDIHRLTDDHAQVQLEKIELTQKVEGLDITSKVEAIQENLNQLKDTLNDKLTGLSQIVRPNVDQPLKETNSKLKEALRVAVKTNAQVLKQFDELSLHYSFMPQMFRQTVDQMKVENDPVYANQRHDPNAFRPVSPLPDGVNFELAPVNIIEGDLNKYLQRTASLAYNDLLDTKMETNLAQVRPLNDIHANANDHSYLPLAQPFRSEPDQNSSSTIETPPVNGKRSGQDPITHSAKQARREKVTVATELPDAQPTYPLITHKHTPSARGNRDLRPFPYFVTNHDVVIYTMRTLHWDALCPYKIYAPRLLSENECNTLTDDFLHERVSPDQALKNTTKNLYKKALADFNRAHKSTEQYCYETVFKAKVYTSIFKDVRGEEINVNNFKQVYKSLDWPLVDKLGDYYKVLRARPVPRNRDTQPVKFEYLPNNVYSYEETRSMLWQHSRITVKANRYWDDRFVRDLPKAVFYSLNDYCPGMPVNLKAECESIGLNPFRALELQIFEGTMGNEPPVYDTEKTVETMVNENTLMDKNLHTVEMYVEGCLNPAIDKYWELDKNWPFELPRLMIRLHAVRLKDLRTVLQEYTKGNKQATVKPNGYENSAYSSARSHPQNSEQSRPGPSSSGLGGSSR